MTINTAIQQLINSELFKEKAKKDAKLRVYLSRIKSGDAKTTTKVELLEKFGYSITVNEPNKA